MKAKLLVLTALVCLVAAAARLNSQTPGTPPGVNMSGVKAAIKMQQPVEGFFAPINGKLDMRATEVEIEPGGAIRDHYHFGPGIRRVLAGELTLVYVQSNNKEQVVRAGEFFYEPGDVNIHAVNRGKETAKLLIVELVPVGLKGSAMVPVDRRAELAANGKRLKEQVCAAK